MTEPMEPTSRVSKTSMRQFRDLRDARHQSAGSREILAALARDVASPGAVLDTIVEHAARLCSARAAQLFLLEGEAFHLKAVAGHIPEAYRTYLLDHPIASNWLSGVGRAAQDKATHQIADVEADADYGLHTLQGLAGFRTLLATPMILGDDVVGVLSVWRTEVAPFDDRERELLEEFAAQGAIAVKHSRLFRELETKTRDLEIASRHKSEFLARMSHELRTPLNAVIGFSEVLVDRMYGEINERQEEYLNHIRTSGKHLLQLVNEILDLSKVEAGQMVLEPASFDVRSALDYALILVQERAAQHAITVTVEFGADVHVIDTDELQFKKVVLNLVFNAVKFTPDGGSVCVRADREGTDLVVTVNDTGIGVPIEEQERIFDSFQQGRGGLAKDEGTGLGLTLSRDIVVLMGGRMWLQSTPGAGSTFGFSIPGLREATGPTSGGAAVTDIPVTVLAVDDQPANLSLLDAHLSPRGYRVLTASSGSEALALLQTEDVDLALLDIVMPGMDGYELCRRIRSAPATEFLPIVMITASGDAQRLAALEAGADDFVVKPFDKSELLARVASLARIKRYHDTIQRQAAELAAWNKELEARVTTQVAELERTNRLRHFLSPQLAELVVGDETLLQSHRREIVVFFADLRNFTTFARNSEPEEVMGVLGEYHRAMGTLVHRYEGTLERFTGDGVMVFFNDPIPCDDAAERAVRMAIDIRDAVQHLSASWQRKGHDLSVGMGIAQDFATLGRIGFEGRFDYAAIGSVTNLAARLCAEASPWQVLVTDRVLAATEHVAVSDPVGDLQLKGFSRAVRVHNISSLTTSFNDISSNTTSFNNEGET